MQLSQDFGYGETSLDVTNDIGVGDEEGGSHAILLPSIKFFLCDSVHDNRERALARIIIDNGNDDTIDNGYVCKAASL